MEPAFPSSVRQCLNSPVIPEAASVKAHFVDILLLTDLRNLASNQLCCLFIVRSSLSQCLADFWRQGGRSCKGEARFVVDDLGVYVLV